MKIKYLVVQKKMTSLKASPPEFIPERFSRWDLFTSRFSRFFLAHLLLLLFLVVVGGIVVRFASFCIFQTANAHFFFFPASVELSKRFESNGSSLKFFFTIVVQTNNENARSLVLRAFFARRVRAERGACVVPFVLKLNPRERARSAHEFPGLTSKTLVLILFEYRKPFPIQYRVAHYEV